MAGPGTGAAAGGEGPAAAAAAGPGRRCGPGPLSPRDAGGAGAPLSGPGVPGPGRGYGAGTGRGAAADRGRPLAVGLRGGRGCAWLAVPGLRSPGAVRLQGLPVPGLRWGTVGGAAVKVWRAACLDRLADLVLGDN